MIVKIGLNDKNIIEFERDELCHLYFDGTYFYRLYKFHFDDDEMYINTDVKYENMIQLRNFWEWFDDDN